MHLASSLRKSLKLHELDLGQKVENDPHLISLDNIFTVQNLLACAAIIKFRQEGR